MPSPFPGMDPFIESRRIWSDFHLDLAAEIAALAAEPARLASMAANARSVGRLDAAERLGDLVMKVAGM